MTTPTIDYSRPYTRVGGKPPLVYMQDGHGFNGVGGYLGEVDGQGDFVNARGESEEGDALSTCVTQEQIQEAIRGLDPMNLEHFTPTGRPQVKAVRKALGYRIAVKSLNEAYQAMEDSE